MNLKLLDLPEPIYIAHRGGCNVYPEHSMIAYKRCVGNGIQLIEQDCQGLKDGAIAIMHDQTVDRTTTSTGLVTDYLSDGWNKLQINASSLLSNAWANTSVPLLEDVFKEFGDSVCYVPEIKNGNCKTTLVQMIKKYGLQNYCLVQSFNLSDLTDAINEEIPVIILGDFLVPSDVVNAGVQYVGVSSFVTDEYISALLAAGLKVIVYTVNDRYQRNRWLAKGVSGFFSDDPLWISGLSKKLMTDPFRSGKFYHGHLANTLNRGQFISGRWGYPLLGTGNNFCLQGWGCPLIEKTYSIRVTLTFDDVSSNAEGWGSVAFCTLRDSFSGSMGDHGYQVLLAENGLLTLNIFRDGSSLPLGNINTTPIPNAGTAATLQIDVTPASISVTRIDVCEPNKISVNNLDYRGEYFHFGRFIAGVTFSDVSICLNLGFLAK